MHDKRARFTVAAGALLLLAACSGVEPVAEMASEPINPVRVVGCYSVDISDFERFSHTGSGEIERYPAPFTPPLGVVRLDTVRLATEPPTFRAEVVQAGPRLKQHAEDGTPLPQVWRRIRPDTLKMWVRQQDGSEFGLVVRPTGDSLIGFGRQTSPEGGIPAGEARAVLRPVNCYTLSPVEPSMPRRQR